MHYNTKLIYPVNPADKYKKQDDTPSYFVNNLVVNPGYDFEGGNTWKQNQESYFDFNDKSTRDSLQNNIYANVMTREMDTLGLTDILNDDYSISDNTSSLIDAGSDVSSWSISTDLLNNSRPSGVAFDVGAYEFLQSAPLAVSFNDEPELWDVQNATKHFSFFPNPTRSRVYLNLKDVQKAKIYNFSGQLLNEVKGNISEIDLESYPSGIYFIRTFTTTKSKTLRVIKN